MIAYGISSGGAIKCQRVALPASHLGRFSANWESSGFVELIWHRVRESTMKPVGKPDAGNPHVRFDERGWEPGRRLAPAPAPILDSTALIRRGNDFQRGDETSG